MTMQTTKIFLLTSLMLIGSLGIAKANDIRDAVRDTRGGIVHLSKGTCVRTKWMTDQDFCVSSTRVAEAYDPVVPPQPDRHEPMKEARTIYFAFDRAVLLPEARQVLSSLKVNAAIQKTKITGFADRLGTVEYNDRLSQKRAETVRDYLIAQGATDATVTTTRWVGKSRPIMNCPNNNDRMMLVQCLQGDRRVEITIDYRQPNDSHQ